MRVEAVARGIEESGLEVEHLKATKVLRAELALAHDPSYISMIETFCRLGGGALDMDTFVSPGSWEAALTSAGGVIGLARRLGETEKTIGFALTRPPGHHAMPDRAMGFCVFNNLAVTAKLLRSYGERIAILDWDVHHGNGTQSIVQDDPEIMYVSMHQSPFYPFEGSVEDIDRGGAKGTTINIPLPPGTAGDVYRAGWSQIVLPVVAQFSPDWILISAGYDAHVADPLADLRLLPEDYGFLAQTLSEVRGSGRTILALEGGYDLDALRDCAYATVRGFAGAISDRPPLTSPANSFAALDVAREAVSRHWAL
jgi:acetoin utilization deacetylase AcuC-like enzyme